MIYNNNPPLAFTPYIKRVWDIKGLAVNYKVIFDYILRRCMTNTGHSGVTTTMAEELGIGKSALKNGMNALIEHDLIVKVNRGSGIILYVNVSAEEIEEMSAYIKEEDLKYIKINPPIQRNTSKEGYVYYLHTELGAKVGRSNNKTRRTGRLTTIMPCDDIRVDIFRVSDYVKAETRLHQEFSDKRFKGEWFHLKLEDFHLGEEILKEEFEGERVDENTESYEETYKNYPNVLDK